MQYRELLKRGTFFYIKKVIEVKNKNKFRLKIKNRY